MVKGRPVAFFFSFCRWGDGVRCQRSHFCRGPLFVRVVPHLLSLSLTCLLTLFGVSWVGWEKFAVRHEYRTGEAVSVCYTTV